MKPLMIATGLAALACAMPATAQTGGNIVEGVDFTRTPDQPPIEETYPDTRGMPRDVQAYIIRWSDCRHWGGEYSEDPVRAEQIARGQREACAGVDALGERIRNRHRSNISIMTRLTSYEPIED